MNHQVVFLLVIKLTTFPVFTVSLCHNYMRYCLFWSKSISTSPREIVSLATLEYFTTKTTSLCTRATFLVRSGILMAWCENMYISLFDIDYSRTESKKDKRAEHVQLGAKNKKIKKQSLPPLSSCRPVSVMSPAVALPVSLSWFHSVSGSAG